MERKTNSHILEGYGLASPLFVNPIDGSDIVGTIGSPALDRCHTCDENDNPVELGQEGELLVRGPQVMQGYWQCPDETAKVLKNGWLKTVTLRSCCQVVLKIVDRKRYDFGLWLTFIPTVGSHILPSWSSEVAVIRFELPLRGSVKPLSSKRLSLTENDVIAHAKKTLTNYKVPRSSV